MARGRKSKSSPVSKNWEKELGWKARYYNEEKGLLKGKQVGGFRIKNVEEEADSFLMWLNTQSNLSDAIRYLIEREIIENGIKDLAEYIPGKRNIEESVVLPYTITTPKTRILEENNNKGVLGNIIQEPDVESKEIETPVAVMLGAESELKNSQVVEKNIEIVEPNIPNKEVVKELQISSKDNKEKAKNKATRWGY